MFSGLLQKDLFKGKWILAKSYFKQNYCHACHTRFAVFFPLPSCCVSSLLFVLGRLIGKRIQTTLFITQGLFWSWLFPREIKDASLLYYLKLNLTETATEDHRDRLPWNQTASNDPVFFANRPGLCLCWSAMWSHYLIFSLAQLAAVPSAWKEASVNGIYLKKENKFNSSRELASSVPHSAAYLSY